MKLYVEWQVRKVSNLTKTIKLHIHVSSEQEILFRQMTEQYRQACNFVSQYIFDSQFNLSYPDSFHIYIYMGSYICNCLFC